MNTILTYAKQPSTWRGLAIVAGALGYSVAPGLADAIAAAVGGVLGLIEVVRNEPITKA